MVLKLNLTDLGRNAFLHKDLNKTPTNETKNRRELSFPLFQIKKTFTSIVFVPSCNYNAIPQSCMQAQTKLWLWHLAQLLTVPLKALWLQTRHQPLHVVKASIVSTTLSKLLARGFVWQPLFASACANKMQHSLIHGTVETKPASRMVHKHFDARYKTGRNNVVYAAPGNLVVVTSVHRGSQPPFAADPSGSRTGAAPCQRRST